MGTVGAQTRLPCPRTDQYFSSDGTKHLVEQLLLKSFTHSMGTPPNTQSRRVCVSAFEKECDRGNSRAIRVTAEVTARRGESLKELYGLRMGGLFLLYVLCFLFTLRSLSASIFS